MGFSFCPLVDFFNGVLMVFFYGSQWLGFCDCLWQLHGGWIV